ncbi:hypothetical protein N9S81_00345, partial [bacterium]|nr:hypothetical protein [bacterium]
MSQLQLLNTVVASLAVSVNDVLSQTYTALYGSGSGAGSGGAGAGELVLSTAPLCSTAEVQALYAAQIIDYETALPSAMHSLGCSSASISSALERRRAEESKKRKVDELDAKVNEAEGKARIRLANNPNLDGGSKPAASAASGGKAKAKAAS